MALIGEMKYLTIGDDTYSVPSSGGGGGGTVTSVGVSNATNGGLSVSGSPVTGSGTITVGHSNVLTSAQTTQAVYPIKIDKNGHISAYGTAVTSMPASDVPSWAKASTKPTYTASEVGALPSTTSIPSKTSDLTNDSDFVEDASYVHTDNNFTTTLKNKLNGIAAGAEVNVQANWSQTTTTADDYIKNKPTIPTTTSQLTNNSGFITSAALPTKVSDLDNDSGFITGYTETDPTVPAWAKASSKPSYTASEVGAVPTSRTVNGKALSSNITLSASDVGALPASTSIPSKTSDLTNDSGFITGYTETDPTVPSWAKASTKPTYTASEVGAVSKTNGYATDSELLDATTIAAWQDILGIS